MSRASEFLEDTKIPSGSIAPLFDLSGKNVLLTGGTRGIGAACARALAQAGASVCLVVRPGKGSDASVLQGVPNIADTQKHSVVEADLADMHQVQQIFDKALAKVANNHIDILVNCAGIQRRHPAAEFPEHDWDEVINVNLKSVFLVCQAAGRHMISRRSGKIINFCSLLSEQGGLNVPAYAASKAALANVTRSLSNDWSSHNVNVNGIAPGYVATDMNTALINDAVREPQITQRIPAGRWASAEDFAGPVVFLASEASKYICGEIIYVDGGWMGR